MRIENLVLNVPADTPKAPTFGEFLEFETLTLCPIDTRCIDRALLRDDEIAWLDAYHAAVRKRLRRAWTATRWRGWCSARRRWPEREARLLKQAPRKCRPGFQADLRGPDGLSACPLRRQAPAPSVRRCRAPP